MKALGTFIVLEKRTKERESGLIIQTAQDTDLVVVSIGKKVELDLVEGDKVSVLGNIAEKEQDGKTYIIVDESGVAVKL